MLQKKKTAATLLLAGRVMRGPHLIAIESVEWDVLCFCFFEKNVLKDIGMEFFDWVHRDVNDDFLFVR